MAPQCADPGDRLRADIGHKHRVPGFADQIGAHGFTHHAQADEAQRGLCLTHYFLLGMASVFLAIAMQLTEGPDAAV
ncbi:hypothetical protein D3C72_2454850 [compost metagenome]